MSLDVVRHLAGTIGPRPAGSPGENKAAQYLDGLFRGLGFSTELQRFRYVGWRPLAQPRLDVLAPVQTTLPSAPMPWTDSTPSDGVLGQLRPAGIAYLIPGVNEWPKFEIVNEADQLIGEIVANVDGPAIPFPSDAPPFLVPGVVVGRKEMRRIQKWLDRNQRVLVRLSNSCEYVPGFESTNVIANLPDRQVGNKNDVLVICAHHDSALGSPGAEDNASGVEALVRVATELTDRSCPVAVRFISFAAEECAIFGSRYYVRRLRERGELGRVKGVINLDMIGAGEFVWLFYGPETVRTGLEAAVEFSGLADRFPIKYDHPLGPSSDHWPFYDLGVPCTFFLLWPYPSYHSRTDVPDKISEDTIDAVARAVVYLAENWGELG